MTTEKRIEIAAMFAARCINEPFDIRASGDTRDKLCRYALAWADALAEIAEQDKPKTRYDWSKAPARAKYVATDANGKAYFWDEKPEVKWDGWNSGVCNVIAEADILEPFFDWRDSLESRPK